MLVRKAKIVEPNDEYIRRKDVAEMLENAAIISNGEYSGYCTEDVSVDSIPAADVAPVKRGKWLNSHHTLYVKCSLCGGTVPTNWRGFFCQNCGANMADKGKVFYDG